MLVSASSEIVLEIMSFDCSIHSGNELIPFNVGHSRFRCLLGGTGPTRLWKVGHCYSGAASRASVGHLARLWVGHWTTNSALTFACLVSPVRHQECFSQTAALYQQTSSLADMSSNATVSCIYVGTIYVPWAAAAAALDIWFVLRGSCNPDLAC